MHVPPLTRHSARRRNCNCFIPSHFLLDLAPYLFLTLDHVLVDQRGALLRTRTPKKLFCGVPLLQLSFLRRPRTSGTCFFRLLSFSFALTLSLATCLSSTALLECRRIRRRMRRIMPCRLSCLRPNIILRRIANIHVVWTSTMHEFLFEGV